MKLNPKQPYGHIYGNHAAAFEQAGKFFDGAGNELDDDGETVVAEDEATEEGLDFLRNILENTQMSKKKIADEAERQGVSWHLVENAANALNVVKFKQGVVWTWRLPEE